MPWRRNIASNIATQDPLPAVEAQARLLPLRAVAAVAPIDEHGANLLLEELDPRGIQRFLCHRGRHESAQRGAPGDGVEQADLHGPRATRPADSIGRPGRVG